ncbi:antitoxin Xre/MbcA/ParS toxin-binding domain-containing protein [Pseudomonas siliginis]|uniref:antitoxin Xre/MbcA/ParS toxin-binding domain-containing protein n=1 Tax=Pseudomonas siliginis TaxID=2842346 RepID=UPI00386459D4
MKILMMGKTMSTAAEPASLAPTPSERFADALALRYDTRACGGLLHNQLDVSFYEAMAMSVGLSTKKLFSVLGVSPTVQRRWKKAQRLTIGESDYAFRQALVFQDALGLFEGSREAAMDWLTQPSISLSGATPASLLSTFVGVKTVEALIWKIENGVYQ